ncbi:unnamed protein product [Ambrosiozyma monospora]|uniref:Unnamed protein product n=1 Tax=Ambrosiozyma monospora TaxID=43982 RepID=A0ACB5T552_AMBMO|nr:unnamed protein product [Ambrosiozyma monospora]
MCISEEHRSNQQSTTNEDPLESHSTISPYQTAQSSLSVEEDEDILPSFFMHDYILNRSVLDTDFIARDSPPPTYQELTASSSNVSDTVTVTTSRSSFVDPTLNPEELLSNNIEKLTAIDSPIKISVQLTKSIAPEGQPTIKEEPYKIHLIQLLMLTPQEKTSNIIS